MARKSTVPIMYQATSYPAEASSAPSLRGVTHVECQVWPALTADPHLRTSLRYNWSHHLNDAGPGWQWYGFHVELSADSQAQFDALIALARRIRGKDAFLVESYVPPQEMAARLEALRAVEVTYDSRVSRYVPLPELMPPEMRRYIDDFSAYGQRGCTVACCATSALEAQNLLAVEFAKHTHYHDTLVKWIQAGRPVRCTTGSILTGKLPSGKTFRQRIAELHVEPEAYEYHEEDQAEREAA